MTTADVAQQSFTMGEVSPLIAARTEIETYGKGLKRLTNGFVLPQGSILRRGGTLYCEDSENQDLNKNVIVQEFVFNEEQKNLLEFGENYIRVLDSDGGIVLDSNNNEVIVTTTYSSEQIAQLRFLQSADVLFIFHHSKTRKLIRYEKAVWKLEDVEYVNGPFMPANTDESIKLALSGGSGLADDTKEIYLLSEVPFFSLKKIDTLIRFPFNIPAKRISLTSVGDSDSILCFGQWTFQTTGNWQGVVVLQRSYDGISFENIRIFESANDANLNTYGNEAELCILRLSVLGVTGTLRANISTNAESYPAILKIKKILLPEPSVEVICEFVNGILNIKDFINSPLIPNVDIIVPKMTSNVAPSGIVTSNSSSTDAWRFFSRDGNGDNIGFKFPGASPKWIKYTFVNPVNIRYCIWHRSPGYHPNDGIVWNSNILFTLSDGSTYTYSNYFQIYGEPIKFNCNADNVISMQVNWQTESSADLSQALFLDVYGLETQIDDTVWSSDFNEQAFSDEKGYPKLGDFAQDRLLVGNTPTQRNGTWLSKTGLYNDFGTSHTLSADDSLGLTIHNRKINEIYNLIASTAVLALTASTEFSLGGNNSVISPLNPPAIVPQNQNGSMDIPAVIADKRIIFVKKDGHLQDIAYDFLQEGFDGNDLSIFASHIFSGRTVKDIAWQKYPNDMLWVLFADGQISVLTYIPNQQILAWTNFKTAGFVESICVLPNGHEDCVFAVTQRDGRRMIEKFLNPNIDDDVKDGVFVDCAGVYSNPGAQISGLERFNNKEVSVLSDGNVEGGIVSNGVYPLKHAGAKVIAGLPFETEIETLNLAAFQISKLRGKVFNIFVDFYRSRGVKVGMNWDRLEELPELTDELGQPIKLFTGFRKYSPPSVNSYFKSVKIKQDYPLPLCVTGITARLDGEN
ncbi:MAG: hypothetical protein LBL00_07845 [Endomicrobium sp.]|jgi:hypothetical protein|nr:hypothetical protein [Endomicrobium sp.]